MHYCFLIGSLIVISVDMSRGEYDEEGYIAELELVKMIMEDGRKMAAMDFFTDGDLSVELKLEGGGGEAKTCGCTRSSFDGCSC